MTKTINSKNQIRNQCLNYYQSDNFTQAVIDAKKYYFTKEKRDSLIEISEEEAFDVVKNDALKLCLLSEEMRNNKKIVLAAVKQNLHCQETLPLLKISCLPLKFASYELKNNHDFMLNVCKIAGKKALRFSSESLRNDASFILNACKLTRVGAFKFASEFLQNSKAMIMTAAIENPLILQYASTEIKNNCNFLHRVTKTIYNAKHSFKRLKDYSKSYENFTESTEESINKKIHFDYEILGDSQSVKL